MNLVDLLISSSPAGEQLHLQLQGIGRLLDVSRALAAEVDPHRAACLLTDGICHAIGCEQATLLQFDEKNRTLCSSLIDRATPGAQAFSVDEGIAGAAARERRIVNVSDPSNDGRYQAAHHGSNGAPRSVLAAPICSPSSGVLLGVLQLQNKRAGAFDHFDEQLLEAFGQYAAVALERSELMGELHRRQATEVSLAVARDVQRAFMPRQLPSVPGYELGTWWYPHAAVGGDYCDVFSLCDRRLGLVIADVSGHGLGPSLIMASVRASLRTLMLEHSAPEVLLDRLARALYDDLKDGLFITMLLAALDLESHRLEYANAGHAPAEHFCALTQQFMAFESTGLPLGVLEQSQYPQASPLMIEPGDVVVLCTDGIVEVMDAQDRQFGREQLRQIIQQYHQAPIEELIAQIADRVSAHFVGENPADDLTILALRRKP